MDVRGDASNPLGNVIELMMDCASSIKADDEAEAKAFKVYFEWCDDGSCSVVVVCVFWFLSGRNCCVNVIAWGLFKISVQKAFNPSE